VRQRCQEGCWNGAQLYTEIEAQGFAGSLSLLRRFLSQLRKQQSAVTKASAPTVRSQVRDPPNWRSTPDVFVVSALDGSWLQW
jgi:hypothetical protein